MGDNPSEPDTHPGDGPALVSTARYPFRKQDPLTGKWYRARWKASLEEIAENGWKVDGPPERHHAYGDTSGFMRRLGTDQRAPAPLDNVALPMPSDDERRLARAFLRRYVTYCARRGLDRKAEGARSLWVALAPFPIPIDGNGVATQR